MDILIVLVLCLLGIILILAEIFLIPGITITIVAGIASLAGGVYFAFSRLGSTAGAITLLFSLLTTAIAFVYLIKSKALDKTIGLHTNIDSTVASKEYLNISVGDEGMTLSRLNPVGKVRVNGITIEAKTLGDFIEEETPIVVLKVKPTQLVVTTK